jgi:hypothetical protein
MTMRSLELHQNQVRTIPPSVPTFRAGTLTFPALQGDISERFPNRKCDISKPEMRHFQTEMPLELAEMRSVEAPIPSFPLEMRNF